MYGSAYGLTSVSWAALKTYSRLLCHEDARSSIQRIDIPAFTTAGKGQIATKKFDHWDASTGTGYEFNTTPLGDIVSKAAKEENLSKLDQVNGDFALLNDHDLLRRKFPTQALVRSIIWVMNEPLPTPGTVIHHLCQTDQAEIVRLGAELDEVLRRSRHSDLDGSTAHIKNITFNFLHCVEIFRTPYRFKMTALEKG